MKHALAALALALPVAVALPVAAPAQPVSDAHLQVTFDRCVQSCSVAHSAAYCREICGCMSGELGRQWGMNEFRAAMDRLRADPADPAMQAQMTRLARYCARRAEGMPAPAGEGEGSQNPMRTQ